MTSSKTVNHARVELTKKIIKHTAYLLGFLFILALERTSQQPSNEAVWTALFDILLQDSFILVFLLALSLSYVFLAPTRFIFQYRSYGVIFCYGLFYFIAMLDQQVYVKTGVPLDLMLIQYGATHMGELNAVLGSGLDKLLLIHGFLALLFILGAETNGGPNRYNLYPGKIQTRLLLILLTFSTGYLLFSSGIARGKLPGFYAGIFNDAGQKDIISSFLEYDVVAEKIYKVPKVISTSSDKQNIVLIILESARADSTTFSAVNMNFVADMPFVSQLAETGTVVDNAYTSVTHTSKALVGILCGMYPRLTMSIVESIEGKLDNVACMPKLLRGLGYSDAFFQSAPGWFEDRPGLLKNMGYSYWLTQEDLDDNNFGKAGYFGMDEFAMVEPSLKWIDGQADKPFFATYLTILSHHPYDVPSEKQASSTDPQKYIKALNHADKFVEAIYKGLEERSKLDNTIFIILGDHGEGFGEHGVYQHDGVPYEEGIRTPLVIHGAKELQGIQHITGLRHHIDLLPTLLSLLGVQWQGILPGKSLLNPEGHSEVISSCWYDKYCLAMRTTEDIKYIYRYGRSATEKYDLREDLAERTNIGRNASLDELRRISKQMLTLKKSVDAFYDIE